MNVRKIAHAGFIAGLMFAFANIGSAALIGYYAMNETNNPSATTVVADSSGNNRNGVMATDSVTGTGAVEGVESANAALYGTAFNFSSALTALDYVDINPAAGTLIGRDSALTYAAWIKPASTQIAQPTVIGTNGSIFDLRLAPSGLNWSLVLKSGNSSPIVTSVATVSSDVWTHVAITKDANGSAGSDMANVNFYINGSPVGSGTIGRAGSGNAARFFLATGASTDQYYNGGLDEARIYNEVLDANTIAGLAVVPEPSVLILFVLGVAGIGCTARRQRSTRK